MARNLALPSLKPHQFRLYLLVGGLPEAVKTFNESRNITRVRAVQKDIHELYRIDASQYDEKKKLVIKYLTNSGVAIEVKAISNPKFPLRESEEKNLLKLYLNDVGLLTYLLYSNNINAILQDKKSINLGSVYETVVAQELNAHGFKMNYYDNKSIGEVDFLIDDYRHLTVLPLEVKSGKDYEIHRALDRFLSIKDYGITDAVVLSNERKIIRDGGITYMPVYYCMFYKLDFEETDTIIPPMPIPGSL